MIPILMRVCIGGTFNIFHKGHKLLVQTAVRHAGPQGYLFIGIATADLVKSKPHLRPYELRKKDVESYLSMIQIKPKIRIEPIQDIFGPTLTENFNVIIVSPETRQTAEIINMKRREKRLKPLTIVEIAFVLAEDGKPIQSRRIINGEIDEEGRIRTKENL
jgi:cytidyltransferase-like protein